MDLLTGASSGDADARDLRRSGESHRRGPPQHRFPRRVLAAVCSCRGPWCVSAVSRRAGHVAAGDPGGVCLFLHFARWLGKLEPDSGNAQARFFAWQLFAAVCEAIELAGDRGLRAARQASPVFKVPVGRFGSRLAESLVVGLLQPNLDDATVQAAVAEVATCAVELEDRGSSMAERDQGLQQLRDRLATMPIVRGLLDKVFVWYDYPACRRRLAARTTSLSSVTAWRT